MKKLLFIIAFLSVTIAGFSQRTLTITNNSVLLVRGTDSLIIPTYAFSYKYQNADNSISIYERGVLVYKDFLSNLTVQGQTAKSNKLSSLSSVYFSGAGAAQTTSSTMGGVATSVNSYTTTTTLTLSTALEVLIENIGTTTGTITYGGTNITLPTNSIRTFTSVYDVGSSKYTPIPSIVVNGTSTAIFLVTIKKFQ